jgi:hypothetical protein
MLSVLQKAFSRPVERLLKEVLDAAVQQLVIVKSDETSRLQQLAVSDEKVSSTESNMEAMGYRDNEYYYLYLCRYMFVDNTCTFLLGNIQVCIHH